ncbi:ABC transporter ATP-binding protein [Dysgonomonas sp. 216]|uniref:metal ABC transporter ATP-binding protein n=1 Tax=Dysgonomonas sp. 216 TaxID=2302934 RepID=UPI0013D7A498|nr:ABC transporter ATP-binding protein [Dysgonomonas sp. 216]NDW18901.1 ABC transporter ATP-binding protein [Dysgonomonas sp. 216]
MNKILQISDLKVCYDNNPPVLENVNLTVFENDFLGIIGPNGGGKTSLLKAILKLVKPNDGSIDFFVNGTQTDKINIGYLPQITQIDKKFPISVFEVILSGLAGKRRFLSGFSKDQKEKALHTASDMGLENLLNRPIGQLSGGQLQRVLLGRAIVDNPDLLILDEPSSYVDKRFETDFYKILDKINRNTAIIMVSHDVGTVISLTKNIACVNGGLHYHSGNNITAKWLEEHYTSCPIEIVGHGDFPHRVLEKHNKCNCCNNTSETD